MTDTAAPSAPEVEPLVGGIDPTQVYVAGTGNIYTAPQDTPMPSAPVVLPPSPPWVDRGLADETGVVMQFGKTISPIKAWQVFDPVRLLITDQPKNVKFTLMQSNAGNMILALGGGSVGAQGIYTPPAAGTVALVSLFIAVQDGGVIWAFYAPRTMVSQNVDIPWIKTGEAKIPLQFDIQAAAAGAPAFQFIFPTAFGTQMMAGETDTTRAIKNATKNNHSAAA